ncbi:5,6-dimethylbenzimidazole synthase [Nocardia australiensis]|uniref:5,6-dimethylbenzimidazole synthase n=1 Tax=Nocardia australiensis TaxID=2887191 RepID=UPI001D15D219|nr:5,6-dimethylbenzimidazole synthase [Nocardia australiensis]
MIWPRPLPLIGDQTSAAERAAAVDAWAFPEEARSALYQVVAARRDIRRFRPDPVDRVILDRVLDAAHRAPSVGHSQPWRFLVVSEAVTRERAARMADEHRLRQARSLAPESARRLLDLQLEGIREAPYGVVVACDRRTPAAGVLGRATFPDADLWSCACAIENLWLAARAEGLGLGWVTLFEPAELAALLGLPDGVVTLGWLCVGWPDERPPAPGLERAGWSRRQPLSEVVFEERWSETGIASSAPPVSHLRAPEPARVVGARDEADALLTPLGSLGLLDRYVDRVQAARAGLDPVGDGCLLLVAGRHPVARLGVSAFDASVTEDVLDAATAGQSVGAVAAHAAGLSFEVVDAGGSSGDLLHRDALTVADAMALLARGRSLGERIGAEHGLLALGEVGVGNTTVAAALAACLLDQPAELVTGLGAGADSAMLERKREVVTSAIVRARAEHGADLERPEILLAALGGPELCVLTGAVLGAAAKGAVTVLDGLVTTVAALAAVSIEPGAAAFLVAGQRSREMAHAAVLERLGLEPLLELRLRAGEGVGAALACRLLLAGLEVRRAAGRTLSDDGRSLTP